MPLCRLGPPPRSFADDADNCIMVRSTHGSTEYKVVGVVIVLVFVQLSRQVHGIPEEYAVKILTPDRSDQPFDKRSRQSRGRRTMLHFMAVMAHWERKQISRRTIEALAAAKARGVKLGNYQRIAKATAARAEAVRPAVASTMHLSATAAADDLNRRGITTASGKRWQAVQVICARQRLGL
jgi:Resolvase, N terminal domain